MAPRETARPLSCDTPDAGRCIAMTIIPADREKVSEKQESKHFSPQGTKSTKETNEKEGLNNCGSSCKPGIHWISPPSLRLRALACDGLSATSQCQSNDHPKKHPAPPILFSSCSSCLRGEIFLELNAAEARARNTSGPARPPGRPRPPGCTPICPQRPNFARRIHSPP